MSGVLAEDEFTAPREGVVAEGGRHVHVRMHTIDGIRSCSKAPVHESSLILQRARRGVQCLAEFRPGDLQSVEQFGGAVEGRAALAAFQGADVVPVDVGARGELFLRQAAGAPQVTQNRANGGWGGGGYHGNGE